LRQFDQLDLEHLPDELDTLTWLVQREIDTSLEIICNHLLKYKEELDFRYQMAKSQVYQETKLPDDSLPKDCP
jgi:hypothetical protein